MLPRPVSVTGSWLLAGPETRSHCLRLSLVRGQWSVKPRDPQWGGGLNVASSLLCSNLSGWTSTWPRFKGSLPLENYVSNLSRLLEILCQLSRC